MEIGLGFIVATFIAGVLTFLAPCTLPLVPAYLGFISGVEPGSLAQAHTKDIQKKIWRNGLAYVLGFSFVFVVFGMLAGLFGQLLVFYQEWLTRIGGVLVILLGLYMLGALHLSWLNKERRLSTVSWLQIGKPVTSFFIGATFAIGWTPCIGPILGTVLLLASSSATAFEGALLLGIFSLGLGIPFLLIAYGVGWSTRFLVVTTRYLPIISRISGVFLILIGVLLVTNNFALTISYGYEFFHFLNYERLMDYL